MAQQIVLNIPNDAQMPLIIEALCEWGGYDPETDGPKPAFAKRVVIDFIRDTVRDYNSRRDSDSIEIT